MSAKLGIDRAEAVETPPASTPVGSYALVTAARDEAENLAALAPTIIAQTLRPSAWIRL